MNQVAVSAEFSAEDCKELGFVKSHLACTSCDKLSEFALDDLQ